MPHFKILPTDQSYSAAEITALDGGAVLNMVSQLRCREADVIQDGAYAFSVRVNRNGLWAIYQRDYDEGFGPIQSFG